MYIVVDFNVKVGVPQSNGGGEVCLCLGRQLEIALNVVLFSIITFFIFISNLYTIKRKVKKKNLYQPHKITMPSVLRFNSFIEDTARCGTTPQNITIILILIIKNKNKNTSSV